MYFDKNGVLSVPLDALQLMLDPSGQLGAAVLDGASVVGNGRLLVLGDADCMTDPGVATFPDNTFLVDNVAAWAFAPSDMLQGHVDLASFSGDPTGIALTIQVVQGGTTVESVDAYLDASANYSVRVGHEGSYSVVGKPRQWLSDRQDGILISGPTTVNWSFPYNGDANNNNAVNLPDLSTVLADYNMTGPDDGDLNGDRKVNLLDLSIVLADYNMTGKT